MDFRTRLISATLLSVMLAGHSPAQAQTSQDFAAQGVATWAGFECSALAAEMNDEKERSRLFEYGYQQGLSFVAAMRAGKIEQEHLRTVVPSGVLMLKWGPTPDFVLGRIFEAAQENALKEMFVADGKLTTKEYRVMLAESRFRKANCSLLGK